MSVLVAFAVAAAVGARPTGAFTTAVQTRWAQRTSAMPRMSSPPARTGGGGDDDDDYRRSVEEPLKYDRNGILKLFGIQPLDTSPEAKAKRIADRRDPNSQYNTARKARKDARLAAEAEAKNLGISYMDLIVRRAQEEMGENFERWGIPYMPSDEEEEELEASEDDELFVREEDIPEGVSEDDPSLKNKVIVRSLIDERDLDPDFMRAVQYEPSIGELRGALSETDPDKLPNWCVQEDGEGNRVDIRRAATKEDLPKIFKHLYHGYLDVARRNPGRYKPKPSRDELKAAWEQFKNDNRHLPDTVEGLPEEERGLPDLLYMRQKQLDNFWTERLVEFDAQAAKAPEYDKVIDDYLAEQVRLRDAGTSLGGLSSSEASAP